MKRLLYVFVLLLGAFAALPQSAFGQGATTAAISGSVRDEAGEALPGATIQAVHTPTGSRYGNITNAEGLFTLRNLNVGGPYKITVSFVGYQNKELDNIFLSLGQTKRINVVLSESATELEAVEISATENGIIDGARTGASTTVGEEAIMSMPTVERGLTDFTRMTPQATVTGDGALSIAGMNNRYNAIFIDGAVNNDVFGLAGSGTNGGQTGISPISVDAIEEFQVVLAPYDVRLGGFAGGGINAVTRSGKNKFEGSVYYFTRNQGLAGKTPTDNDEVERERLADFSANTFGMRVGGPLIKNKLFFFANAEVQRDETPQPFNFEDYQGASSRSEIQALSDKLRNEYGYDAGGFENTADELKGEKFLVRFDWNASDKHKVTLRHSYTRGRSFGVNSSNNRTINFSNNGVFFPSTTNSSALEVKSQFGNNADNNLILGLTLVRDDRDPLGNPFPYVIIQDDAGSIRFGSEQFSTANLLHQDIITLTDNFNLYKGKHTITFGTHNEFYNIRNVFVRQNFGVYEYSSLSAFMNDENPSEYYGSYSLVDNVAGDETAAAAEFTAMQLGFYVQDEFAPNDKLNLTFGLRADIPIFTSTPEEDSYFNNTTIPMIEAAGYDLAGARAGEMPGAAIMLSPRIGFNYDITGEGKTQLRGGLGIFTSRVPFVWPGGAYNNNGLTVGGTFQVDPDITFNPDPFNQPRASDFGGQDAIPSGQMDLFAADFKFPQVFRTNIAVDQMLPLGLIGTLEFVYTKTLNNVMYKNLNLKPSTENLTGTGDDRPIFDRRDEIDPTYTRILLAENTNEGYSYNITAQIQKPFENGFTASLAYTFGRSESIFDGTSSQNSSQWRGLHSVNGRNNPDGLYISDFDMASRIVGFLSYRKEYLGFAATTISLFYNGQSGDPYSYIYNDGGRLNNEDSRERNLIYVPNDRNDIVLVDDVDRDGNVVTAEEQWNALNEYIEGSDYLSERRGQYAERNASRLPFINILDLRILQDFYLERGNGSKHNLQISLDVFNFTNMINKNWGRRYLSSFGNIELLNFEGYQDGTNTPTFTYTNLDNEDPWFIDDSGINSSRWQAQIGIRYSF